MLGSAKGAWFFNEEREKYTDTSSGDLPSLRTKVLGAEIHHSFPQKSVGRGSGQRHTQNKEVWSRQNHWVWTTWLLCLGVT